VLIAVTLRESWKRYLAISHVALCLVLFLWCNCMHLEEKGKKKSSWHLRFRFLKLTTFLFRLSFK